MVDDVININLTERQRRFIDRQIESGQHGSSGEVVDEALRRYRAEVEAENVAIDALWVLAKQSVEGEAVGDFIDIHDQADLDQVMEKSLDRALRRARTRRAG